MKPFPCPARPVSGLRRIHQKFEDCSSPDVCFKRGCLLASKPMSGGPQGQRARRISRILDQVDYLREQDGKPPTRAI